MTHICKWVWLLSLGGLLHCGPATQEDSPVMPAVPAADRESWDARFEMSEKGLQVGIQAAYMQDRGNQTYADSGVQVEFFDPGGALYSRLSAVRLTLDRRADQVGIGGEVVIESGDSLQVMADTLVWERKERRLRMPGAVRIVAVSGSEEGRNLQTDLDFQHWSMDEVVGRWRGRQQDRVYEVEIQARREESRRQGGQLVVHYDSVMVEYQGTVMHSHEARFNEAEGMVYFSGGVASADSVRQFSAREMDYDPGRRRTLAQGDVVLRQGQMRLEASELVEDRESEQLQARGQPAAFYQGARSIEAGQLDYSEKAELLEAKDQVVFREGDRVFQAARLVYQRSRELLEATGGISLQTPEFAGVIQSGSLLYDLEKGQVDLSQEPRLRRQRSSGVLVIRADEMHIDLQRELLAGEGAFRVESTGVDLEAERGLYAADTEQLVLVGQVVLTQEREEDEYSSHIQADSMLVDMRDGAIEQIHIPEDLKATMRASATRVSWIQGTGGQLFFQDERLERVELERGADVTYKHLDEDMVSRIQGRSMSLYFEEDSLQRVQVQGQAEFLSRLPQKEEERQSSINQVRGEKLEILLEDGSIVEVRVVEKIEGSYYPPPKEK